MYIWPILALFVGTGDVSEDAVSYCERMLELLTDLEAQLPTRRFFNILLDDTHFIVSGRGGGGREGGERERRKGRLG